MAVETVGAGTHFDHTEVTKECCMTPTLPTTNGQAYLTLAGLKSLYVRMPKNIPAKDSIAFMTTEVESPSGGKQMVYIPVKIDRVGENAPRAKMTDAEKRLAGFGFDDNISQRFANAAPNYVAQIAETAGTHDLPAATQEQLFWDTAPATRIYFHVASSKELEAAGLDHQARGYLQDARHILNSLMSVHSVPIEPQATMALAVEFAQSQGFSQEALMKQVAARVDSLTSGLNRIGGM